MVRRDDDGSPAGDPRENPSSRCDDPAGASPVSVSGDTPSSRLPAPEIYPDFLDSVWSKRCADPGVLVRYCDDFVVLCKTERVCREAERRVRKLLAELKLELHPDKTKRVDLGWGKHGIDFLGCHLRKRFSGPVWDIAALGLHHLHGTVAYPGAA